jgi:hypothetical protein
MHRDNMSVLELSQDLGLVAFGLRYFDRHQPLAEIQLRRKKNPREGAAAELEDDVKATHRVARTWPSGLRNTPGRQPLFAMLVETGGQLGRLRVAGQFAIGSVTDFTNPGRTKRKTSQERLALNRLRARDQFRRRQVSAIVQVCPGEPRFWSVALGRGTIGPAQAPISQDPPDRIFARLRIVRLVRHGIPFLDLARRDGVKKSQL